MILLTYRNMKLSFAEGYRGYCCKDVMYLLLPTCHQCLHCFHPVEDRSHDPFLRIRFLLVPKIELYEHIENDHPKHGSVILKKTDGNRTWSIFIRHSSRKMKGADKFCMISLWSFWRQIEDPLSVLKIGWCEHITNELPTFSPQKLNLEIGPSERLLPIFSTKNRILKIGSREWAFRKFSKRHFVRFLH